MAHTRLIVAPHLPAAELARRYRACRQAPERARWHALLLMAREHDPKSAREAAALLGYTNRWLHGIVRRYNERGPDSIPDGRASNKGAVPVLTPSLLAELDAALDGSPPEGGLWTCAKVAGWVEQHTGERPALSTAWSYLRQLGAKPKVPRPRHTGSASPEERDAFKGGSRQHSSGSGPSTRTRRSSSGARTRRG